MPPKEELAFQARSSFSGLRLPWSRPLSWGGPGGPGHVPPG